jgi:hypothetical protein
MESFNILASETEVAEFNVQLTDEAWTGLCRYIGVDHAVGFDGEQFVRCSTASSSRPSLATNGTVHGALLSLAANPS